MSWKQKSGTHKTVHLDFLFFKSKFPLCWRSYFYRLLYKMWLLCTTQCVISSAFSSLFILLTIMAAESIWDVLSKPTINPAPLTNHRGRFPRLLPLMGKQILLIYQDYADTNAHLAPICKPTTAPTSNTNNLAPETSGHVRNIWLKYYFCGAWVRP